MYHCSWLCQAHYFLVCSYLPDQLLHEEMLQLQRVVRTKRRLGTDGKSWALSQWGWAVGAERGKGSGSDPDSHQKCSGKTNGFECVFGCVIFPLSSAERGGWLLLSPPHGVSATTPKSRKPRGSPSLSWSLFWALHRELKPEIVSWVEITTLEWFMLGESQNPRMIWVGREL